MNSRNPTGRVAYRSPGRRRLADELAGYHRDEPKDPLYRRLLGVYVRATAKIAALPPQARALRKQAEAKQKAAFEACKARIGELEKIRHRRIMEAREAALNDPATRAVMEQLTG